VHKPNTKTKLKKLKIQQIQYGYEILQIYEGDKMRPMGFRIDREEETAEKILMPCDFMHIICTGATGSGKTASLILPAMQERLKRGHSIIAYTYKGHEHRKIKHLAKIENRLEDVMEIGKPHGRYINLMASLELSAIQKTLESLIGGGVSSKGDNYWTVSASRLGVGVVDISRKLNKLDSLITAEFGDKHNIREVKVKEKDKEDKNVMVEYEYAEGEPSFKTLVEITKSPRNIKRFFSGIESVIRKVKSIVRAPRDLFDEVEEKNTMDARMVKKVAIALLRLEKSFLPYKDFSISLSEGEASGNNGVLQVLNNAILNISNKDYINTGEVDILRALNEKAIVIVDIEGLDTDIHGVLLESLLSKLSSRIRHGKPEAVSIFVDEANRVLLGDMDIHNDTLRESNVELILAVQNEDQMIDKFGVVKWDAIRKNFKHSYEMDSEHKVSYNNGITISTEALLIEDVMLDEAEYAFNALETTRNILTERFSIDMDLPKKFLISYDIVSFEKDMTMQLIDEKLNRKEIEYIGKELKKKLDFTMNSLGYIPKVEFKLNI